MIQQELKAILDKYVTQYNCIDFIENDPISIPHNFTLKEDIEIAGFLAATIAWGNRKAIIKSARQLMSWMDNSPYDFIMNASSNDLKPFYDYKYRTFNGIDCVFFINSLTDIYKNHGGLQSVFEKGYQKDKSIKSAISYFREVFFITDHQTRTEKHVANTFKNSAAKRINMYLRWMVRNDNNEVDFGLWKGIATKDLMMPLDVHSGTVAREFNILKRTQNDWKAVKELTEALRLFDVNDPVKYDFALFGLGVNR